MLNLFSEFQTIIQKLEESNIQYAVCGGMAMAIHGFIRSTVDIDIVLLQTDIQNTKSIMYEIGYLISSNPMSLGNGQMVLHRMTKVEKESGDFISLDLIEVTPILQSIWNHRLQVSWEHGTIQVIDKSGLIEMKRIRNNKTDEEDIQRLIEND